MAALAVQPEGGSGPAARFPGGYALECDAEFPRSGKLSLSTVGFKKFKGSNDSRKTRCGSDILRALGKKQLCADPEPQHANPRKSKVFKLPGHSVPSRQERKQAEKGRMSWPATPRGNETSTLLQAWLHPVLLFLECAVWVHFRLCSYLFICIFMNR